MTNLATLTVLRQSAAFGGLPQEVLNEMVSLSRLCQFTPGEVLFREGEPGSTLYGVISGRVRLQLDSEDGRALNLMLIEAGEVKPVIDRRYSLAEASEALRYQEEGHPAGKIVIIM